MAKQPQVKCPICEKKFYREDEFFVKEGRRYYHEKCYETKKMDEEDREAIHTRCQEMFGVNYSKQKINGQIKKMLEDGKTVSGINGTLYYWYDVKKNNPEKANYGINIVNYVYGEALDYFCNKNDNQNRNLNIDVDKILNPNKEKIIIHPTPIGKPKKIQLFDIH